MKCVDRLKDQLKVSAMTTVDLIESLVPRSRPSSDRLEATAGRLIAHRGAHDGSLGPIRENTVAAFENALQKGASGLEFDIRWTADDIPVVHHDRDTSRVFAQELEIAETDFATLRQQLPEIPTLEEVLDRFHSRAHLMIELKKTEAGLNNKRLEFLDRVLLQPKHQKSWKPADDFHFIGLAPELLLKCEFVPRRACMLIAEFNTNEFSEIALKERLGGLTGQYLLLGTDLVNRHHDSGQSVGTGFASSSSVLYREIHRGIDWIFTNHVAEMRSALRRKP